MTDDADRLDRLLRAAMDQADAEGDTLIAAMLADCIDTLARRRGSSPIDR